MFGLALNSHIGHNLTKFKWLPISGKGKYYASTLYTLLFNAKPVCVEMTLDGAAEAKISSFISVTNGPTIGGKTPISPDSCPFDGKLNLVMSNKLNISRAINMFTKVDKGEHLNDPCVSQISINVCKDAITLKGKRRDL
jgi:diacylglycerol kinase family enzyme